ncbi:hypothetical protein G6O69_17275 [Pseudenhygromyxa sp. WMMC2535]|uniref:hypothetical protein n=1 Tax=Pseudenhygromyxa sp. WMMC2535 TaxID=2712867 RepID=UPI0015571965|nr:hypothetical protein [Pseudenhygromyxa sp. WMMC2535]NVB39597.1 hypothetical protein [Pseudenhygromyxa sp. WMMC2535]
MSVAGAYLEELAGRLGAGLQGAWPPDRVLALGERGVLRGGIFEPLPGEIEREALEAAESRVSLAELGLSERLFFTSTGAVNVLAAVGKAGADGLREVDVSLHFSRRGAVFFWAKGLWADRLDRRSGQRSSGRESERRGGSEPAPAHVDALVHVEALTVAIARGDAGCVKLSGRAQVEGGAPCGIDYVALRVVRAEGARVFQAHAATPLLCIALERSCR